MLVAKQCQGDEETFLELVDECIWLTGKEVSQYAEDGTLATYYENAQKAFVESGRLAESVPVEDYVLFDVIQEACSQVYGS